MARASHALAPREGALPPLPPPKTPRPRTARSARPSPPSALRYATAAASLVLARCAAPRRAPTGCLGLPPPPLSPLLDQNRNEKKRKRQTERLAPCAVQSSRVFCGLTRDSYSRRRPKASKNGDPQRAGSVCRKSSFFLCAALQLLLSKLKASRVMYRVLLCRVYCAAPQRPNGPHTLAPHSPGGFPSRFRVSSPSGRDDKTLSLSLSSSGLFCSLNSKKNKENQRSEMN